MELILAQEPDGTVILISKGHKQRRCHHLTPEDAQHLSNRLQSFAKSQHTGLEIVHPRNLT